MTHIALGITGASGALYAVRTLAALLAHGATVELVVSDYGRRLLRDELGPEAAIDRLPTYLASRYGVVVEPGSSRRPQQPRPGRQPSPAAARAARRWSSCRAR